MEQSSSSSSSSLYSRATMRRRSSVSPPPVTRSIEEVITKYSTASPGTHTTAIPRSAVLKALREMGLNPTESMIKDALSKEEEKRTTSRGPHTDNNEASASIPVSMLHSLYTRLESTKSTVPKFVKDFLLFVPDKDLELSKRDLKNAIKLSGEKLTDEEFRGFYGNVDVQNRGKVSVYDFVMFFVPGSTVAEIDSCVKEIQEREAAATRGGGCTNSSLWKEQVRNVILLEGANRNDIHQDETLVFKECRAQRMDDVDTVMLIVAEREQRERQEEARRREEEEARQQKEADEAARRKHEEQEEEKRERDRKMKEEAALAKQKEQERERAAAAEAAQHQQELSGKEDSAPPVTPKKPKEKTGCC